MNLGRVLVGTSLVALAAVAAQAQSSTETYSYDALGRLISVVTTGGQNNAETHSICYDDAGNRTQYVSDSLGAPASCAGGSPPPPPPPPPSNQPPVANSDAALVKCWDLVVKDLVLNDTDPEGNYPLVLLSITRQSGTSTASLYNSTSVQIIAGDRNQTSVFSYAVRDSLGASSTGSLTVTTNGGALYCSGTGGTL